jgi:preprotein translocase SecE subunit
MARQTRQQRRARRAQQEPALAGGPPPRGPSRPTANGGGGDAEPNRRGENRPRRTDERERHGFGPWIFVQESVGELKKVEWPSKNAVLSGTAVVLVACVIVGLFLWLNDELWKYVVQHVLLR